MRILLDECLLRRLKKDLPSHEVATVPEMGWASIRNGRLLRLAEAGFDVFVRVDRNMQYQQNLDDYEIAVVVLIARSNRYESFQPLVPSLQKALETIQRQGVYHVGA